MNLLVISPEVVLEVEARMKRNYLPPMLPPRKHSRHAAKPHLPTVQEQAQGKQEKKKITLFLFLFQQIRFGFLLFRKITNDDRVCSLFCF